MFAHFLRQSDEKSNEKVRKATGDARRPREGTKRQLRQIAIVEATHERRQKRGNRRIVEGSVVVQSVPLSFPKIYTTYF